MWPWGAAKKVSVCTVSRREQEELGEIPPTPFLSLVFGQQLNFIDSFWVQTTSFFSLPIHIRRATSNRMMTPPSSSVQKWVLRPKRFPKSTLPFCPFPCQREKGASLSRLRRLFEIDFRSFFFFNSFSLFLWPHPCVWCGGEKRLLLPFQYIRRRRGKCKSGSQAKERWRGFLALEPCLFLLFFLFSLSTDTSSLSLSPFLLLLLLAFRSHLPPPPPLIVCREIEMGRERETRRNEIHPT